MAAPRAWCKALPTAALGLLMGMPATAMARTIHLTISGDPGARYSGTCTLTTGADEATVTLEGGVPAARAFAADGLSCRLRAEGRVVVEVVHDGSRARSAASGGVIRISVR